MQLEMAGALAIIDIRGASYLETEALISLYNTGDVILQINKHSTFKEAVENTCFDILLPEVAREMTILLAVNEDQLDDAIEKGQEIYNFPIFHKLIRD